MWDNFMIHIDESTVDTDLKGSISEQQMENSVKMTEYFKMYQRAPEGHGNRTYKFLYGSAKLNCQHRTLQDEPRSPSDDRI